jgi:hypothetical protein
MALPLPLRNRLADLILDAVHDGAAREGAEQHCQLGNSAVARHAIVHWLASLYPGMPVGEGTQVTGLAA